MNLKQVEVPKEQLLGLLRVRSDTELLYFKLEEDKYIFFIRDEEGDTIPHWDLDISE
jgi:hypothetical protein